MAERSPAFQRWDHRSKGSSPEGTVEVHPGQPSLRDLSPTPPLPSVEALGLEFGPRLDKPLAGLFFCCVVTSYMTRYYQYGIPN